MIDEVLVARCEVALDTFGKRFRAIRVKVFLRDALLI